MFDLMYHYRNVPGRNVLFFDRMYQALIKLQLLNPSLFRHYLSINTMHTFMTVALQFLLFPELSIMQ